MVNSAKYYFSQLLALPFVGILSLVGGFLIGGLLAEQIPLWRHITTPILIFGATIVLIRITSVSLGSLLVRFGFLPDGSQLLYPHAISYEDYERRGLERKTMMCSTESSKRRSRFL